MKRKKKTQRQKLIEACDKIFSEIIRKIGYCEKCGTTENLQCSHVHSRTYLNLRWDTQNAKCMCYRCHFFFWHKKPIEAIEWFVGKFGQERLDYLNRQKQFKVKYSVQNLQMLLLGLKEQLKR